MITRADPRTFLPKKPNTAHVEFIPTVEVTVLRACEHCGAPHPGAGRDTCPSCGSPVMTPARPTIVRAALSGRDPGVMFARALLCVANGLRAIARKV